MPTIYALNFPGITEITQWPAFLPGGFNKIALIAVVAVIITITIFLVAGRRDPLNPKGIRTLAEGSIEFVESGIVMETMGTRGLKWTPFLLTMFFFIFLCNIWSIIPPVIMPATGRMAIPLFLAVMVWVIFIVVGFKNQGIKYIYNALFPPGVPKALYILVVPIEFISTFLVRPFSLAVRLYANMLAGHILVVTFAVLTAALWTASWQAMFLPLPFIMLIFIMAFEVLVSLLQAYIFSILTAVYIAGAQHPEH